MILSFPVPQGDDFKYPTNSPKHKDIGYLQEHEKQQMLTPKALETSTF